MSDVPQLISLNRACEITSLSRTMINRLRADGRFPSAVPVGEKRIAFCRDEVVGWVRERINARDKAAA
ncbi:AlpA family phage regulatory protein [Sphingobium sp. SA2]|uniref:helix-turn-helix transcriptional regulator n=1 Tax=Sphingobium sp. SA2 TaxID=1524832 RepID=UPI0028C0D010|nr:AlpA family phage regulatory protein [Sphingobium sp. SA2]MDT7536178.1 AlpA family phage regulatory protein [Sphingobium sp. SA2]